MNKYDTVSDGGDNVKHTLALNNTQLNNTTNPLTPLSNKHRFQKPISSTENPGKQDPLRSPRSRHNMITIYQLLLIETIEGSNALAMLSLHKINDWEEEAILGWRIDAAV